MDLENKLVLLSGELERMNDEIETWKRKYAELEQERDRQIESLKEQAEVEKKAFAEREVQNAATKHQNEKAQIEAKNKELKQKIIDLENKITYLSVEIERLHNLYEETKKEAESWKEKCAQIENSTANDLEEMKNQVDVLRRSSIVTHLIL